MAVSLSGIANDFVGDDLQLVTTDIRIQSLAHWRELFTRPFWPPPFPPDLYRPLLSAALSLEYAFGFGNPLVFRVVSYLLYAGACVALLVLCSRILPRPYALAAAVLFAVHPVHVEAVALAVGQGELSVALAAFIMCFHYIDVRRAQPRTFNAALWVKLTILYAAASLFKEQGLIIPALAVAAELTFIHATFRERVRATWLGYAVLAAVACLVAVARYRVLGQLSGATPAEAFIGVGAPVRILTMLAVVPQWLRLFTWPMHLRADYSPREMVASTTFGGAQLAGSLILIAAVALAWRSRKNAPGVTFGLTWTALALFPVSNLVVPTGIVLAERTLFLPSAGVMIATVSGAQWTLDWARKTGKSMRLPDRAAQIAFGALIVLGMSRSIERQRVWRNQGFFIARSVQNDPLSFRMQEAYGNLLFEIDQPKLADEAYVRAMAYVPPSIIWHVRDDLAKTLRSLGKTKEEAEQLRASLLQQPNQEFARAELVVADLALGRYSDAASEATQGMAYAGNKNVLIGLRAVADSAERVDAPPGSVRVTLQGGMPW